MKKIAPVVFAFLAIALPAQAAPVSAGADYNTTGLGFPNTHADADAGMVSVRSKPDRSEYTLRVGDFTVESRYDGNGIFYGLF